MTTTTDDKPTTRADRLRHDILANLKANDVYISGELYLKIIFRSEAELVKIAQAMNIPTK